MNLYSRFILAWDISNAMTARWCKYVFDRGISWYSIPEIFNTNQGSQLSSDIWVHAMEDNGIRQSMDGKGSAIDNVFTERFWRSYTDNEVVLLRSTSGWCPKPLRCRYSYYSELPKIGFSIQVTILVDPEDRHPKTNHPMQKRACGASSGRE